MEFAYSLLKSMAFKLECASNYLQGLVNTDGWATTLKSLIQSGKGKDVCENLHL